MVKLLADPDPEYIEYYTEAKEKPQIKKGMIGQINILLPNGQYHVEVLDKNGEAIAYFPMPEEFLESAE